jgi:serine protease Do
VTSALLLGGAALSLVTGIPAGAQVAQNDVGAITPRVGSPASFADLTAQLQPAVVGIQTRQKVTVNGANPFAGTPFEGLVPNAGPQTREAGALGTGFIISADGYVV